MSTINALTNVQQLSSGATSTSNSSALSGDVFEKVLDFAMDNKSLVLPTPVNTAIDLGVEAFNVNTLVSDTSSIQDGIEDVFNDLSVGIASSFVAALSGEDSATAIIAETTEDLDAEGVTDAIADASSLSSENVSNAKAVLDTVTPLFTDNDVVPVASALLSNIEATLLDDNDDDEEKA